MLKILLEVLFLITCVLLVLVVLLQKGRGGGLSGVFGGMGQSAFGTRVGDVFTWITIVLAFVFLVLAIGTTMAFRPEEQEMDPPGFDPAPRALGQREYVRILDPVGDADIYYTLDGTEPTSKSFEYDQPVAVQPGQTLKARAYRMGWKPSPIATAEYPVAPAPRPVLSPAPGPIDRPINVALDVRVRGAAIHYTLDGSEPTRTSPVYEDPVRVEPGQTIRARTFHPDREPSEIAVGEYPRAEAATTTAPAGPAIGPTTSSVGPLIGPTTAPAAP
jgi:preprotein translocase subunit SecG